ncbi:MAG TPA: hypothetical protein VLX29_04725 [Nitrospirota bacterium]|nr:hypothetical protein [Nitrospirota bacterium]
MKTFSKNGIKRLKLPGNTGESRGSSYSKSLKTKRKQIVVPMWLESPFPAGAKQERCTR